jgi:hypothetical protein
MSCCAVALLEETTREMNSLRPIRTPGRSPSSTALLMVRLSTPSRRETSVGVGSGRRSRCCLRSRWVPCDPDVQHLPVGAHRCSRPRYRAPQRHRPLHRARIGGHTKGRDRRFRRSRPMCSLSQRVSGGGPTRRGHTRLSGISLREATDSDPRQFVDLALHSPRPRWSQTTMPLRVNGGALLPAVSTDSHRRLTTGNLKPRYATQSARANRPAPCAGPRPRRPHGTPSDEVEARSTSFQRGLPPPPIRRQPNRQQSPPSPLWGC